MRRAFDGWERDISVNGQKNNLRFADDIILLANNKEEIVELIRRVENESQHFGLEFNTSETKVIIVDR